MKLLADKRGSVSIEALLSIAILLVVISVTWGVCILIFNISTVSSATQLSAQAGLLSYDRQTYRGTIGNNQRSANIAQTVFRENSCGTLADQFTGERPETGCGESSQYSPGNPQVEVAFDCAGLEQAANDNSYLPGNCGSRTSSDVLRATVSSDSIDFPFSYLLDSTRQSGAVENLNTTASSYSFIWPGEEE